MINRLCEKSNCFCHLGSGFKLLNTVMIFLKEFFEKVDFEKYQQMKKHAKLQRVNGFPSQVWYLIVSISDLCLPLYF